MPANVRWTARYTAFYDAYYQELLAGLVIERWQRIDLLISLLVAITASGSAIAGLAWWNTSFGKPFWTVLATTASLGGIFHSTARVANRLQQQVEVRRDFSLLRGGLQNVLYKMTSDGDSEALEVQFEILRTRLVELIAKLEPDIAVTSFLRSKAQNDLAGILRQLGVAAQLEGQ